MIDFVKGRLAACYPGKAVIEIAGVGILLEIPAGENNINNLIGEEVTFYTRLLLKDDAINIYGFRTAEQRKLFNLVLGISGFGPRLALSLLGIFSVSQLYIAVLEENIALLCHAPGVGRKAAQRLVLELKEKLPKVISAEELSTGSTHPVKYSVVDDITEALCALGYSRDEAVYAVGKAAGNNRDLSREELLKQSLTIMARGWQER